VQGREKINLVYLFTKMGFSILVSDVDTVWMRNPLPYMAQYPEADVLTSSDHLVGCTEASSELFRSGLGLCLQLGSRPSVSRLQAALLSFASHGEDGYDAAHPDISTSAT
jgi:hypothetical protein